MTRSSHTSSSPFGSKLYTFPPGEKTTFTAQAMSAPSRTRLGTGSHAFACSARAIVRRRWKSASSARVGVIVSSSARRVSRAASRQRAASASRPFAASLTTCSRWSECTSVSSAPSVAASRSRYHVTSVSTAARASSTSAARAAPLGQCLALAPHARGLRARRMVAERLDAPRGLRLGGLARLGAARAAGLGHGARGRAGVEELVGVGRARQRQVALAPIARLAALQQLARALEIAAARACEREALAAAEPERRRHLGGGERREAHLTSQRERTVASSRWGCAQTSTTTACAGGSSIDFSRAFCTTSGIGLGVPDQVHAALGRERPQLDVAPQLAHLVDADLRALGPHLEQVGMAALERALGQAGERGREAPRVRGDAVAGPAEQQVGVARDGAARRAAAPARPRCRPGPRRGRRSQSQRLAHARGDLVARRRCRRRARDGRCAASTSS